MALPLILNFAYLNLQYILKTAIRQIRQYIFIQNVQQFNTEALTRINIYTRQNVSTKTEKQLNLKKSHVYSVLQGEINNIFSR